MPSCRLRPPRGLLRLLVAAFLSLLLYSSLASLLQYENVFSRGYDYDELPETPLFTISFYRQFFDYLETPLAYCQKLIRFGKVLTWYEPVLCLSAPFHVSENSNCLVYSFHHAMSRDNYLAFEKGVASMGCEVHVFDLVGNLGQYVHGEIGDGSVTWHVVGGPRDPEQFRSLPDIVQRLGHDGRTIHYLRLFVDFDADRKPRLNPFVRHLQYLVLGELELMRAQVEQLQLALALRPASLKPNVILSYRRVWEVFNELHKRGFTVLNSRATGRVIWLPGLPRMVATQYNLLMGRDMPASARLSALGVQRNASASVRLGAAVPTPRHMDDSVPNYV